MGTLLIVAASRVLALQDATQEPFTGKNDCTITNGLDLLATSASRRGDLEMMADVSVDQTRNGTSVSRFRISTSNTELNDQKPKLTFPRITTDQRYKMATLHLDKGIFIFDFLRNFLSFVHPYDIPIGLLTDAIDKRISTTKLISESVHLEAVFLSMLGVSFVLACVVPGAEIWLACRPIKEDYKPCRHPGILAFLLSVCIFIMGTCLVTMVACNEAISLGIGKVPTTIETALQDMKDYHVATAMELRKCLTRSLDIASEAILADLDNVEELLGKPVQAELSGETGLDVALDALLDLANASQRLSAGAESLLMEGERARELGMQLNHETDQIRRDLEGAIRACSGQDRPLCAIIDSSGLRLALRTERLLRDDRLLRLRDASKENLTEASRQARGEYLYVPHHIARSTLDARNQIRREISNARARTFEETRNIEESSTHVSKQVDSVRSITDYVIPYVVEFDRIRWLVGLVTVVSIFPVWLLLVAALCCYCGSSENKVRPTLLCGILLSCFVSIALWIVFAAGLGLASHTEMLLCRPLYDPDYRTMEAVLETRAFLGKRLAVPLKDLFERCERDEAAYPAFRLENTVKLDQITAHWSWSGLSKALSNVKVDLKGLRIFTPILRQRLQSLLYACGLNLTEHRIMIQGPILNRDLNALSDQLDSVARQVTERTLARELQMIGSSMRDLMSRRIKPLMKLQDDLVYQLALLELQVQPLQRQVNQSISHLKTIQYYIDNQGEKIAQLKTKMYVERIGHYLDQWRAYVLTEMGTGVAKCRPIWEILEGIKYLFCGHILGPLDGFWFATLLSAVVMIASTPTAHVLSLVYKKQSSVIKDIALLPQRSSVSRESSDDSNQQSWQTPEPPPPQDGW